MCVGRKTFIYARRRFQAMREAEVLRRRVEGKASRVSEGSLGCRRSGHGCWEGRHLLEVFRGNLPKRNRHLLLGQSCRWGQQGLICHLCVFSFKFFVETGSCYVALAGALSTSYTLQLEISDLTPQYDKVNSLKQERLVENTSHHLLVNWPRNRVRKAGTDRQGWVKTQTLGDECSQAIVRPAHSSPVQSISCGK